MGLVGQFGLETTTTKRAERRKAGLEGWGKQAAST